MFVYLYVHQIVYGKINSVSGVIAYITKMKSEDQLSLYEELKEQLLSKGLLNLNPR